jgi:hypothetical protein
MEFLVGTHIAEGERVGSRYVSRLLRLAFLAPEIVEAIAAADQPPEDLPSALDPQEKAVGIA